MRSSCRVFKVVSWIPEVSRLALKVLERPQDANTDPRCRFTRWIRGLAERRCSSTVDVGYRQLQGGKLPPIDVVEGATKSLAVMRSVPWNACGFRPRRKMGRLVWLFERRRRPPPICGWHSGYWGSESTPRSKSKATWRLGQHRLGRRVG